MRLILICAALVAALAAAATLPGAAGSATAQASVKVAVVPGFTPPAYPGFKGVPAFPTSDPQLSGFQFTPLAPAAVTPAALQGFDTVLLYGIRWSAIPPSAQAAINAFAQTGKVVIWDADATGSQNYASFVHPFSTTASGEVSQKRNGSVVTFPAGANPLASPSSSSPLYLDPAALVASNHLIQDMTILNPGAANWAPSLIAANDTQPTGGWVLSWTYGSIVDHTGMVIYSGMDADAFSDAATPNYALKALAIQLGAQFQRAPASCSPSCAPPPVTTGGSGGSGIGSSGNPTFAQCTLGKLSRAWVRGTVPVSVTVANASGIRGELRTSAGKLLASASAQSLGSLVLPLNTHLLPSNKRSNFDVLVYVNAEKACTLPASILADNIAPRLLKKSITRVGSKWKVTVKPSETVRLGVWAHNKRLRGVSVKGGKVVTFLLPRAPKPSAIIMLDRAGNTKFTPLVSK